MAKMSRLILGVLLLSICVLLTAMAIYINALYPRVKATFGRFQEIGYVEEKEIEKVHRLGTPMRGSMQAHMFIWESPDVELDIEIEYPKSMRENESASVLLRYYKIDWDSETTEDLSSQKKSTTLKTPVSVKLTSTAFDILPSEMLLKPNGTKLPTTFAWTISPKKEGDHLILIDISKCLLEREKPNPESEEQKLNKDGRTYRLRTYFVLDGKNQTTPDNRILRFPVKVYTIWGVSRVVLGSAKIIIGSIGFILLYPVISDYIKSLVRRKLSARQEQNSKRIIH